MEKEDALNYEKTLQKIGGVGVAPVPVEISLAAIAMTLQSIQMEMMGLRNVWVDTNQKISMLPSGMQSAINQLSGPLTGNASNVSIAITTLMQILKELKDANRSGT